MYDFSSLRKVWSIPRSTAYELIGEGLLRKVKIRGRTYILDEDIRELVRRGTIGARNAA